LLLATGGVAWHTASEAAAPSVTPNRSEAAPPSTKQATPKRSAVPAGDRISYPSQGSGTWLISAAERSPREGGGSLLRYRVAVERGIRGLTADTFAAAVTETLNDPRGWTAGGTVDLRRVGRGQPYDFTIYLATPMTRDELCGDGVDGYTSCRNGDRVVINVARWAKGAKAFGGGLATYRQYVINHEVGHRLGNDHQLCPGPGEPAPVMQQQTLGMHGCRANGWPYLNGSRYAGSPGRYRDPLPPPSEGTT
jgi:hypothetical protein